MVRVGAAATTLTLLLSGPIMIVDGRSQGSTHQTARVGRALTTTSTDTRQCDAELDACEGDPSCNACHEVAKESHEECAAEHYDSLLGSDGEVDCDVRFAAGCCEIANGDDCENNALQRAVDGTWQSSGV